MGAVFIYFAADGELIKIGRTKNAARRIATLATGNPRCVTLLGTMKGTDDTERMLHHSFRVWRVRGEWFERSQSLLDFIAAHTTKPE